MKVDLWFWLYDSRTKFFYDTDRILRGFTLKHIPQIGTKFRFDLPCRDAQGRYAMEGGSFRIDGGCPFHATVAGVEIDTDLVDLNHTVAVQLNVDRGDDSEKHVTWSNGYIDELVRFHEYVRSIKKARKIPIQNAGFPSEAIHVMHSSKCLLLSDVASSLSPSSFGEVIAPQVESALRKYGLQLSADEGAEKYDGPPGLPK